MRALRRVSAAIASTMFLSGGPAVFAPPSSPITMTALFGAAVLTGGCGSESKDHCTNPDYPLWCSQNHKCCPADKPWYCGYCAEECGVASPGVEHCD